MRVPWRHPELAQGGSSFDAAKPAPTLAVTGGDPPFALERTLRPGVVIAVGGIENADRRTRLQRSLQEYCARERFIIRMRREQEQAGIARKDQAHGWR